MHYLIALCDLRPMRQSPPTKPDPDSVQVRCESLTSKDTSRNFKHLRFKVHIYLIQKKINRKKVKLKCLLWNMWVTSHSEDGAVNERATFCFSEYLRFIKVAIKVNNKKPHPHRCTLWDPWVIFINPPPVFQIQHTSFHADMWTL